MNRFLTAIIMILATGVAAFAQADPVITNSVKAEEPAPALKTREAVEQGSVMVPRGTRVPLTLINSISTKHAAVGDKIYLESVYPVVVDGRILIPPGTYVSGSITSSKRPGRVKGKGELYLRFEHMILPNGTMRDFTGRIGQLDGRSPGDLDREEGKINSAGGKGEDAGTVAQTTAAGASIGVIAGAAANNAGMGIGLGAAAGAAAGLASVLLTRGPDATLERGTQLDMVLDRDLFFTDAELSFDNPVRGRPTDIGNGPDPNSNNSNSGRLGRFPL
jgi:hypothetical protein